MIYQGNTAYLFLFLFYNICAFTVTKQRLADQSGLNQIINKAVRTKLKAFSDRAVHDIINLTTGKGR